MQRCPNCQNPLPPKVNFCRQCGHAITDTAAKVATSTNNASTVAEESPLTGSGKQPPVSSSQKMGQVGASQKMPAAAPVSASQKMGQVGGSQKLPPVAAKPVIPEPVNEGATIATFSRSPSPEPAAPPAPDPAQSTMDEGGGGEYEGGATLFGVEGSLGAAPNANQNQASGKEIDLIGHSLGSSGYKIVKKLGEGGMGAVYKATHNEAKPLAIKVLHSEFTSEPKVLERFFNEAKAVNKINQPHIVDISDFGFLSTGQPYIAMEFLEGFDLAGRLQQQSPLLEGEALDITIQVLEALYAAHQAGIIHRDLKPENIFLLKNKKQPDKWFVKVLDFGIAKLSQSNSQQTQSGTILGTPRYMSPEQARGERDIGASADIYSLGIIIYEMVTGRAPFDEPSYLGYLVAHQRKIPPQPKEFVDAISDDTNRIIMRCLEKTPDKRYATAKDLRDELVVCLQKLGNVKTRLQTPMGQFPVAADTKNPTFMLSEQAPPDEKKPEAPKPVVETKPAPVSDVPALPTPVTNDLAPHNPGSTKTIGIVVGAVVAIAIILYMLFGK